MYFRLLSVFILWGSLIPLYAQNLLENGKQIHQLLREQRALPSTPTPDLSKLRVAIIDSGFEGYTRYGKHLGSTVKLVDLKSAPTPSFENSKHGFAMAQIFLAASGALSLPEAQRPELLLLTANGYTEFTRAVKYCLKNGDGDRRVNIILHSKQFDWGSDFKGGGFFNAVVEEATQAGILWINSVGNSGSSVYFSEQTQIVDEDVVALPGPANTLFFKNSYDDQEFKITLSWDDFQADPSYATIKDLDFNVLFVDTKSKQMSLVDGGLGNKRQIGRHLKDGEKGVSGNAFEQVNLRLKDKGLYAIRIYARSKNFKLEDKFQLRISANNPQSLNFIDKNHTNEVMAPADRADVVAVGTLAAMSSRGKPGGIKKPDVLIDFGRQDLRFIYSDAFQMGLDTSSAAAIYSGVIANLMVIDSKFSPQKLISFLRKNNQSPWRWPL